jgi:hypothetical protein
MPSYVTNKRIVFDSSNTDMVTVEPWPAQSTPIVAGAIMRRALPGAWDAASYPDGLDLLARSIMALYSLDTPTSRAVDRVYRLLDTALFGRNYLVQDGEIIPTIPTTPTVSLNTMNHNSMLMRLMP